MNEVPEPAEAVIERGMKVLMDELGLVDTIRFLQAVGMTRGDYTAERHEWLEDGRSLDDIIADLTRRRMAKGAA